MPINGTDLINNPWNTTFKVFTDLFQPYGGAFYLIPISFIGLALYMKTRNPVVVCAYFIAVSLLMSGGGMFSGYAQVALLYTVVCALAIVGMFMSIFFMRK